MLRFCYLDHCLREPLLPRVLAVENKQGDCHHEGYQRQRQPHVVIGVNRVGHVDDHLHVRSKTGVGRRNFTWLVGANGGWLPSARRGCRRSRLAGAERRHVGIVGLVELDRDVVIFFARLIQDADPVVAAVVRVRRALQVDRVVAVVRLAVDLDYVAEPIRASHVRRGVEVDVRPVADVDTALREEVRRQVLGSHGRADRRVVRRVVRCPRLGRGGGELRGGGWFGVTAAGRGGSHGSCRILDRRCGVLNRCCRILDWRSGVLGGSSAERAVSRRRSSWALGFVRVAGWGLITLAINPLGRFPAFLPDRFAGVVGVGHLPLAPGFGGVTMLAVFPGVRKAGSFVLPTVRAARVIDFYLIPLLVVADDRECEVACRHRRVDPLEAAAQEQSHKQRNTCAAGG